MHGAPVTVTRLAMQDARALRAPSARALRATSALQHPNIVGTLSAKLQVLEPAAWPQQCGNLWLVQEFCNGGTLQEAMRDGMLRAPALPAPLLPVMALLRGAAQGLAALHAAGRPHGALTADEILLKVCRKGCLLGDALRACFVFCCPPRLLCGVRGLTVCCARAAAAPPGAHSLNARTDSTLALTQRSH